MRVTLERRVWLGLMGTLLLAVVSAGVALLFAVRSEQACKDLIARNQEQSAAIYELQIALLEQGGLTASYLLDGSSHWLNELDRRKRSFERILARAENAGLEPDELAFLSPIREAYNAYAVTRDDVIGLYANGREEEARRVLLTEMSARYDDVYRLCEALSDNNKQDIDSAVASRERVARRVSLWVGVSLAGLAGLVVGMAWYLISRVFGPLRRMSDDARDYLGTEKPVTYPDKIEAVGAYVDSLKTGMARAQSDLSQTSRRLLDAEQLAQVGRLAAGVAHEIRSPLTSLKLRLYSMRKGLNGDPRVQGDANVMSEELGRLDDIVRNFLEFSKPPELRVQRCDVSLLLDKTLELLRYKLRSANISVEQEVRPNLPPVLADPQQFQQVLLNVINNAIDAQPNAGYIRIRAGQVRPGVQRMMRIRIEDGGPGVPVAVADRIFDPFFSGRDDGVGLGLWIAHRIVTEHGGSLELESSQRGAAFAVVIPVAQEGSNGQDFDRRRRAQRVVGA